MCSPTDGTWSLSDAYPITRVTAVHENTPLQHVTWSSHGAELAVVDITGRVSFYTVYLVVNQLTLTGVMNVAEGDMGAIVGFWWLPPERAGSLHPAQRGEKGFQYGLLKSEPWGPCHPVTPKAAAVAVTRGGTAKLWFADKNSKFREVLVELENMASLLDVFSHASVSFNKGTSSRQVAVGEWGG